ncbi:RrF2 family transcriptional regulator [Salibaculum griseiflavum]|uniref:Transcriptional regulator n=1 Tax=Salibaculum griseiflavum TaxID=1914409 RepID=A0A2V1P6M9_9RHOB|nr:Rrf2 family transcriptional regulator [Salibaculum griseiflavum]PWG17448.1 transcriptional regulator [Salibaculum griseiflavum]
MRLTTRTNLASRVLMFCAVNEGRLVRSGEVAEICNASANHVARVVNLLHAGGFIETVRGRTGGLRLAAPADRISIGEVFRVFESDIPFAECFYPATNTCPLAGECRLRPALSRALAAFYAELDKVTLSDLVKGNCGLHGLLAVPEALSEACEAAI